MHIRQQLAGVFVPLVRRHLEKSGSHAVVVGYPPTIGIHPAQFELRFGIPLLRSAAVVPIGCLQVFGYAFGIFILRGQLGLRFEIALSGCRLQRGQMRAPFACGRAHSRGKKHHCGNQRYASFHRNPGRILTIAF